MVEAVTSPYVITTNTLRRAICKGNNPHRLVRLGLGGNYVTRRIRTGAARTVRVVRLLGPGDSQSLSYYSQGTPDRPRIIARIQKISSNSEGWNSQTLHGQHVYNVYRQPNAIKIKIVDEGGEATARGIMEDRRTLGGPLYPKCTKSVRRPSIEEEEGNRLLPKYDRNGSRKLLGGSNRVGLQSGLRRRNACTSPFGVDPGGTAQGKDGEVQRINAPPALAQPPLVVHGNRGSKESPRHKIINPRPTEVLGRGVRAFRPRQRLRGIREEMRNRDMAEAGSSATENLTKGTELMMAAWEDTTQRSYDAKWQKFIRFCDADHRNAYDVSELDVLAYLGWLFGEGIIGPRSISSYISVINSRYRALGLNAPATVPRITMAKKGYIRRWENTPKKLPRVPMTLSHIHTILETGMRAVNGHDGILARACTAVTFQYYTFGRPGLTASFKLDWIQELSRETLAYIIPAIISGRKNRDRNQLRLVRTRRSSYTVVHPLDLISSFYDMQIGQRQKPIYFFEIRGQRCLQPSSRTQDEWLKMCLQRCNIRPPDGGNYEGHSCRPVASSCAFAIGVPLPVIKLHADWALEGTTFEAT